MIRLYGEKLLRVTNMIDTLAGYFVASEHGGREYSLGNDGSAMMIKELGELRALLSELDFPVSSNLAEGLSKTLIEGSNLFHLRTYLQILGRTVHTEMENVVLLVVPTDKKPYYVGERGVLPDSVLAKFPSIASESEEARKCYALGRPTAAVFHSMRMLEIGLVALAKALKVPSEYKNWEPLIGEIESEIRKIGPGRGTSWKEEQRFYSEAAVHFRHFKDAWRNHVMHIRESHNEDSAHYIVMSVNTFMEHLASELTETT